MLNRFHPVYHSYTYLAGSRVDVDRVLEPALDLDDPEEFIDDVSAPPEFYERLSPVSTTIGTQVIKGRNWTDMMIKCYRVFGRIYTRATAFLRQALVNNHQESTMVPFMSITVDPDTLTRLIEQDYEAGENSYAKLIELFEHGVVAPSVTTPFHAVLPLLPSTFDRRLCVRLGMAFYAPVLRAYERYLKSIDENEMVVAFWAPESAADRETLEIVREEFDALCKAEKFRKPHLVLLLDADCASDVPLDRLMKSWCTTSLAKGAEDVSVVFRDPVFSEWMMTSHPSIKKIIDRTIAKIDRGLDEQEIDYGWAHFESIEALTNTPKDAVNFEQRILKLCELGYLSISPDVYVRRKRNGKFAATPKEPMRVKIAERKVEDDRLGEKAFYARWRGWALNKNGEARVAPNAPFVRKLANGVEKRPGSPCWKIAWNKTQATVFATVGGDPKTMKDGMLGVLAHLTGSRAKATVARNVEDFLVQYGLIHWREHFIQHTLSEADIRLDEIVERVLRKGVRKKPTLTEIAAAGYAAQAYFFLLDSCNSYGMQPENMDQRAMFQNVVMLTLAVCNGVAVHHYLDEEKKAKALFELLERELFDFSSAFERYGLEEYGVTKTAWNKTLKSEIAEEKANIVERAARRTAARHLEGFGFADRFGPEDAEITTNVGHNWSYEVDATNYEWANPLFCGVREA